MDVVFSSSNAGSLISSKETQQRIVAGKAIIEGALKGEAWNDRNLGWFSLADTLPASELRKIQDEAAYVRGKAETMIVIGIGGSNRGAMAAIQALRHDLKSPTRIVFAGDTLSGTELKDAVEIVRRESVVLNVIAKDFNTVEPGIAFRILRETMIEKYGPRYNERIIATGSRSSGQLHELALKNGFHFLDFPESIGGRFSVLSAVGLFPMAVAGIDIAALVGGAKKMEIDLKATEVHSNPAVRYAVDRNFLFSKGFIIESLVVFEPSLVPLARWWVQLFAETEGKIQDAVFPTYFSYSEDLHAVGQYVQQGRRCVAETFLRAFHKDPDFHIPTSEFRDGFEYLDGKSFEELNHTVYDAALKAHAAGGVPCLEISCPELDAPSLGGLFYFFMFACYVSACLIGVNPFNQDGVENYKRNMYNRLGKKARG